MFSAQYITPKMQRAEMVVEYLHTMLKAVGCHEDANRLMGIQITDVSTAQVVLEILRGMKSRVVPQALEAHRLALLAVQDAIIPASAPVAVHAN